MCQWTGAWISQEAPTLSSLSIQHGELASRHAQLRAELEQKVGDILDALQALKAEYAEEKFISLGNDVSFLTNLIYRFLEHASLAFSLSSLTLFSPLSVVIYDF